MQQIKDMVAEKKLHVKELVELRNAAQIVVDMVDPVEEGAAVNKMLVWNRRPKKSLATYSQFYQDTTLWM